MKRDKSPTKRECKAYAQKTIKEAAKVLQAQMDDALASVQEIAGRMAQLDIIKDRVSVTTMTDELEELADAAIDLKEGEIERTF